MKFLQKSLFKIMLLICSLSPIYASQESSSGWLSYLSDNGLKAWDYIKYPLLNDQSAIFDKTLSSLNNQKLGEYLFLGSLLAMMYLKKVPIETPEGTFVETPEGTFIDISLNDDRPFLLADTSESQAVMPYNNQSLVDQSTIAPYQEHALAPYGQRIPRWSQGNQIMASVIEILNLPESWRYPFLIYTQAEKDEYGALHKQLDNYLFYEKFKDVQPLTYVDKFQLAELSGKKNRNKDENAELYELKERQSVLKSLKEIGIVKPLTDQQMQRFDYLHRLLWAGGNKTRILTFQGLSQAQLSRAQGYTPGTVEEVSEIENSTPDSELEKLH